MRSDTKNGLCLPAGRSAECFAGTVWKVYGVPDKHPADVARSVDDGDVIQ